MSNLKSPLAIIDEYTDSAPVRIDDMARAMGLAIRYENLPQKISGKISRSGSGDDYFITVSSAHPLTRQRFTIAHEIAHFVFHRNRIGDGIVDNELYRSHQLDDAIERQANNYAARLLMPQALVRKEWDDGCTSVKDIALRFNVSQAVAKIRIEELQLK